MASRAEFRYFGAEYLSSPSTQSWKKLNDWVINYRKTFSTREIWTLTETSPIDVNAIDKLIRSGWKVIDYGTRMINGSICNPETKIIELREGKRWYSRDLALFHEITHAVYVDELNDVGISPLSEQNRAISEWLARKSRSNPELLLHTITSFKLEPHIYDRVSLCAFKPYLSGLDKQFAFPFGEEIKKKLSKVYMYGA
jgi:hypothetical protein